MTFCKLGFRMAERLSDVPTLSRILFHIFTKCPSPEHRGAQKHRHSLTHLSSPIKREHERLYHSVSSLWHGACRHACLRSEVSGCLCALHVCTYQMLCNRNELFVVSFRIQSSYSALQRINQDLEEKIHRDVSVFSPLCEPVRVSFSHKNSHACR